MSTRTPTQPPTLITPVDPAVRENIELTRDIVGDHDNLYALRVKGNSLSAALITDGDIVVLRRTDTVADGDLAAVSVAAPTLFDPTTRVSIVARYHADGETVTLAYDDGVTPPTVAARADVEVQGRVIAVVRNVERKDGQP